MAGDEPTNFIRVEKTYTFNQAIEYMKARDRHPTNGTIRWSDAKTGKKVYIGYT